MFLYCLQEVTKMVKFLFSTLWFVVSAPFWILGCACSAVSGINSWHAYDNGIRWMKDEYF